MNDIRFRTEQRKYTKIQRLRIWWNGALNAIREVPDTHTSDFIEVKKGEPGYEEAPWSSVTMPNPARFRFEDGQYVKIPESSQNNDPGRSLCGTPWRDVDEGGG